MQMQTSAREARLEEQLRVANLRIEVLQMKLDKLARRLFGRSSERLDDGQLELLLDADEEIERVNEAAKEAGNKETTTSGEGRPSASRQRKPRIPEHLPLKEVILDPEAVKAAPEQWQYIGEEVTEQLDYTPASFTRLRLVRRKYVHKENRHEAPVIAPLSPMLQERCAATPSLLAHCMVSRYRDHLPWYRLERIYAGLGVEISRQTLCNWSGMAADAAQLVSEQIKREVFADGYVQIDETPIDYLVPGNGKTKTGYLWVAHNPARRISHFEWHTSRSSQSLQEMVPQEYRGVIQCDGYAGYQAFAQSWQRGDNIHLAGCWAHVRRKFYEAMEHSGDARQVMGMIQQLYAVEEDLRQARAGPGERREQRQQRSRPLMESLKQQLLQWRQSRAHLPQSSMGKALSYALKQWEQLQVCLEDGRVELDNNLVENAIRPSAIGKKNWLFIGESEAGLRAATFYTLVGNCQHVGMDAYEYLLDLFTRLPKMTNHQVKEITPHAWAQQKGPDSVKPST